MTLHHASHGEGTPLLAIHGWTPDHRLMTGCLEPNFESRPEYRRLYPDLPAWARVPPRSRSLATAELAAVSGLELMRWIQAQQLTDVPSIGRLLGMRFDRVEKGHVVGSLDTRPDFANPLGTVHGGIAATLLDSVMGCAVHTPSPPGPATPRSN
jgi:hypothetical protein